ncbi:hypothetical protein D3C76_1746620 [compost metagenome]
MAGLESFYGQVDAVHQGRVRCAGGVLGQAQFDFLHQLDQRCALLRIQRRFLGQLVA